jgi:hypothetical protein
MDSPFYNPAELYANSIRKKMQYYYPAWLPNEVFRLGDVGVLENKLLFHQKTNLDQLGITFKVREDQSPMPFNIQAERGIQLAQKIAGELNPKCPHIAQNKAGVAVEFFTKGAFVIRAPITLESIIEDIAFLEKQILDLYKKGHWNKEWVIIGKLVKAPGAIILVSRTGRSKIELSAEAEVPSGTKINLGDINQKFNVSVMASDVVCVMDEQRCTPFFQLLGIKRKLYQEEKVKSMRVDGFSADPFDEVTPILASQNKKVADSLYLDLIWEPVSTNLD